jgi:hypothetical protein
VVFLISASWVAWDDRCMLLLSIISWDEILQTFCLGWPQTTILLISAFQAARIIGASWWTLDWYFFQKMYCLIFHSSVYNLSRVIFVGANFFLVGIQQTPKYLLNRQCFLCVISIWPYMSVCFWTLSCLIIDIN